MRGGGDSEAHNFQEYTYKKITPCDVCSQVLRGKKKKHYSPRNVKVNTIVKAACVTFIEY